MTPSEAENMMKEVVPAYIFNVTEDTAMAVRLDTAFKSSEEGLQAFQSQLLQDIPQICLTMASHEMQNAVLEDGSFLALKSLDMFTIPKAVRLFLFGNMHHTVEAHIEAMVHDANVADESLHLKLRGVLQSTFEIFQTILDKYLRQEENEQLAAAFNTKDSFSLRDMVLQGLL